MGPQSDAFTPEGIAAFFSGVYTVSQQSDRVGHRLEGPLIAHARGADIVSDGIPFGAVQITGDGQPVILMADRGTTGGYTKIATVIAVDIPNLAQTLPGSAVTFHAVSVEEAHRLLREQEAAIARFKDHVQRSAQIQAQACASSSTTSPTKSTTKLANPPPKRTPSTTRPTPPDAPSPPPSTTTPTPSKSNSKPTTPPRSS